MNENLAPWRSVLQRALHRNRSQVFSRYFQLATINEQGFPTNRTVVFRGFLDDSNQIKIITDTRSDKFTHLQNNHRAEICWYFTKTREQFRISGKIILVTAEENTEFEQTRQQTWQRLSDNAKAQFFWSYPQILPEESLPPIDTPVDKQQPVSNFCLLLFAPEQVDHLELRGNPQNHYYYSLNSDNQWITTNLSPQTPQ